MATITYLNQSYDCATALKGSDYVHLLDSDGHMVAAFDGVTDFSDFSITDGTWTTPTDDHDCYVAVVKDDGTMGKGGHKCSDILPKSGGTLTGLLTGTRAHFTASQDASETGNQSVALRLGPADGKHLDIDNNEILAKEDASTMGTLYLQGMSIAEGGEIIGGTWSGSAIPVANGGTGATTAAAALTNLKGVNRTGDNFSGKLIMGNGSGVRNGEAGWVSMAFTTDDGTERGNMMLSNTNAWHVNVKETGASYADRYMLPAPTADKTADNWYNILTSKNVVTVAQGGTGATNAADARTNLGAMAINPQRIEMGQGYGYIDFHFDGGEDYSSRIIEGASGQLAINGAKFKDGVISNATWNGSAIPVANGGTGATSTANARANLGAAAGTEISYTLSDAGWYRIASSVVGIGNNIGEFTIAGGGSGTHTLVSFKASISSGKYPQIVQLINSTYSGANQYTKARIVYHTTYSGNYAYLEVYKNGTASSSTKFMFSGFGWTLHSPTAGSIPDGYTSKEYEFVAQTGIPTAGNVTGTVAIANGGTGATTAAAACDNIGAVSKSGDTMTGTLTLKGSVYAETDSAIVGSLDCKNSNIIGVNGIYMNDASDGITEGIHFYRSATSYDSLWAASGKLYFTPNRTLTTSGTAYTVYHTGNKPSAADVGAQPALGYTPIQQGGGTGQNTNKIYIGWASDATGIKAQVDSTDMGYLATIGTTVQHSIIYSATEPTGSTGKIWLKPVE